MGGTFSPCLTPFSQITSFLIFGHWATYLVHDLNSWPSELLLPRFQTPPSFEKCDQYRTLLRSRKHGSDYWEVIAFNYDIQHGLLTIFHVEWGSVYYHYYYSCDYFAWTAYKKWLLVCKELRHYLLINRFEGSGKPHIMICATVEKHIEGLPTIGGRFVRHSFAVWLTRVVLLVFKFRRAEIEFCYLFIILHGHLQM